MADDAELTWAVSGEEWTGPRGPSHGIITGPVHVSEYLYWSLWSHSDSMANFVSGSGVSSNLPSRVAGLVPLSTV